MEKRKVFERRARLEHALRKRLNRVAHLDFFQRKAAAENSGFDSLKIFWQADGLQRVATGKGFVAKLGHAVGQNDAVHGAVGEGAPVDFLHALRNFNFRRTILFVNAGKSFVVVGQKKYVACLHNVSLYTTIGKFSIFFNLEEKTWLEHE